MTCPQITQDHLRLFGWIVAGLSILLFLSGNYAEALFCCGFGFVCLGIGGKSKIGVSSPAMEIEGAGGIVMIIIATLIAAGTLG